MLRDCLVCGINDQRLQRLLLSELELTFAKALELAQAAEAAERNTRELEKAAPSAGVHVVYPRESLQKGGGAHRLTLCYRCGGKHPVDKCRFKESDCHHCGKKGHLAKVCRSKQRGSKPRHQANTRKPQEMHHVDVTDEDPNDTTNNMLNVVGSQASPPLMVTVGINQAKLQMEVASVSIISMETYTQLWPEPQRPKLQRSTRKLRTYTGKSWRYKVASQWMFVMPIKNKPYPYSLSQAMVQVS